MKFIFLSGLFLFVSCAQMSVNITDNDIRPFKEFSTLKKVMLQSKSISLEVIDARGTEPDVIGFGYTGVKYDKTPVKLKTDLATFLSDRLATEFTKRDVLVSDQGEVQLQVNVTKFDVHEYIEKHMPERAVCEVEFNLASNYLTKNYTARFWAEVTSPGDLGDGLKKLVQLLRVV
jgi:uncharacterized lipoprotein YajG